MHLSLTNAGQVLRHLSALVLLGLAAASAAAQTPQITSVSKIGTSQYQTIVISGSGFGTLQPYNGDSGYISLWDLTRGWQAGYVGSYWGYYTENAVTLSVVSWQDNLITLGGFSGAWGQNNWTLNVGDSEEIDVWNPQSGNGPASTTTPVTTTASSFVTITVQDLTTGQGIANGETLSASDNFQVTVTTDNVDCAGQFVVTALGARGAPPEVLVQSNTYIIGPNSGGGNAITGGVLTAATLPSGHNDWKISASCNATRQEQFAANHFEFFVKP